MELDYFNILLRWLHIFAAMALVGGALFQRLALVGPSSQLPEDIRTQLGDQIRRRWSKVVMLAILILLVTGLTNGILTMVSFREAFRDPHPELGVPRPTLESLNLPRPGYDILLTVKAVLALIIFFIASALAGRGRATAGMRQKAAGWLSLNLALAVILVAISGVMRSWHTGPNIAKIQNAFKQMSDAPPPGAPTGGPSSPTGPAPAVDLPLTPDIPVTPSK